MLEPALPVFLNSWKIPEKFLFVKPYLSWLSLRLTEGPSGTKARMSWLDKVERRCRSHPSKPELWYRCLFGRALLWELGLLTDTTPWTLALVKWELVPGAGQSWAKETGSAGCPWGKCRLGWHFYLFLILSWVQCVFGLISHGPLNVKIFYWVAEKQR